MSCHNDGVTQSGDVNDLGVYHVSAVTDTASADGSSVRLSLNCDELKEIYESSPARSLASFREFSKEVEAEANAAAQPIFQPATELNNQFVDSPNALRAVRIRICIRWRWLRIYIGWRF